MKRYGYNVIYLNPSLNEEIILGSKKRKRVNEDKYLLNIEDILSLPFDTEFKVLVEATFPKLTNSDMEEDGPVDIVNFGLNNGLFTEKDLQEE